MRDALTLLTSILLALTAGVSQAAETFRDCPDCPPMTTVPAGSFKMGASGEEYNWAIGLGLINGGITNELPQHQVSIGQFSMAITEVTRDQFDAFVKATGYKAAGQCWVYKAGGEYVESAANDWRHPGFAQGGNHPVVCVNWDDATAYVRWLSQKTGKGYRLPTESEWEYAARAGTVTGRYWGWENRASCQYANVADQTAAKALSWAADDEKYIFPCTDGNVFTGPVGQYQANSFGLYDMLGNAEEWTEDCYNDRYTGAPTDGSAWLTGNCSLRVIRGGSWDSVPRFVASALRVGVQFRSSGVGFRVARTN